MSGCRNVSWASFFAVLLILEAEAVRAQLPLGAEFRANSYTPSDQRYPSVGSDSAGNFVIVWSSIGPNGGYGIFGQRYLSSGGPLGTEFQVNTFTTGEQRFSKVTYDSSGNFVVVWQSTGQYGSFPGIFGQRYASSGARIGTEFQVHTFSDVNQKHPSVASGSGGNFVVVWHATPLLDVSGYGVLGQRYDSFGGRLGVEFQVNSFTTGDQKYPAIASDSAGNFIVVWENHQQNAIAGQRYSSSGGPLGSEFQVYFQSLNLPTKASVASDPAGDFVVLWSSYLGDGSGFKLLGQRYSSFGGPLGVEFQVNSYTSNVDLSSVVSDSSGNFVVVWQGYAQDGSGFGVFGRRYASSGALLGPEFRVNSYTTGNQRTPSVASDSGGKFVVTWTSLSQDGSGYGVFGQRYCVQPLTAVSVSATGSTTVCTSSTGGMATATDTGGGISTHQWYYRVFPLGPSYVLIAGQTGTSYLISGVDFPGPGTYKLVCQATPSCGTAVFSPETVTVTVAADTMAPAVTPPSAITTTQTLCM